MLGGLSVVFGWDISCLFHGFEMMCFGLEIDGWCLRCIVGVFSCCALRFLAFDIFSLTFSSVAAISPNRPPCSYSHR
jgi:hypothetical protein